MKYLKSHWYRGEIVYTIEKLDFKDEPSTNVRKIRYYIIGIVDNTR